MLPSLRLPAHSRLYHLPTGSVLVTSVCHPLFLFLHLSPWPLQYWEECVPHMAPVVSLLRAHIYHGAWFVMLSCCTCTQQTCYVFTFAIVLAVTRHVSYIRGVLHSRISDSWLFRRYLFQTPDTVEVPCLILRYK